VFQTIFGWIGENVVPIVSEIVGYVVENWPQIQATIEAVLNPTWALIELIFGQIKAFVEENQDAILGVINTVWEGIQGTIEYIIGLIQGIITVATGIISGDWQLVWEGIQDIADTVWTQIQNLVETAVGVVKGLFEVFGVDLGAVWDGIETKATTVWNNIKTAILTPIEATKTAVEGIMGAIQGFVNGIKIPHIPTPHINVWTTSGPLGIPVPHVDVQWYALGLDAIIAQPTLIGVGEAGPERVKVTPLGKRGGDSDSKMTLIYNDYRANGSPPDMLQLARALEWRARVRA
jgi:hypothetical protein